MRVCSGAEDGKDVYITDLNSTNGTFVRGPGSEEEEQELQPMEWTPLLIGSQVVFGAHISYTLRPLSTAW